MDEHDEEWNEWEAHLSRLCRIALIKLEHSTWDNYTELRKEYDEALENYLIFTGHHWVYYAAIASPEGGQ